jgi:hypothetical protein
MEAVPGCAVSAVVFLPCHYPAPGRPIQAVSGVATCLEILTSKRFRNVDLLQNARALST